MAGTLIQSPDAQSFARNLKDVIVSSASAVNVKLKVVTGANSEEALFDEDLSPNLSGRIIIDFREIVSSRLDFIIPTSNWFKQTAVRKQFKIYLDNSLSASFYASIGGIDASTAFATFAAANLLTWQPQTKQVTASAPNWLTYHFTVAGKMMAKFYFTDGTFQTVELGTANAGDCYSANVQFSRLWALYSGTASRYGMIDIYATDSSNNVLSYVQRLTYRKDMDLDRVFLCVNSVGGIDTFIFTGESKFIPELTHNVGSYDDKLEHAYMEGRRKWSQNTGILTLDETKWLWEIFTSSKVYAVIDGALQPVVIDTSTISASDIEQENSYSFEWRRSDDRGLMNITRGTVPTNITIEAPDTSLFFLAPRLSEFASATLTDSLYMLCQEAAGTTWKQFTLSALRTWLKGTEDQTVTLEIDSTSGQFFKRGYLNTELRAHVFQGKKEITSLITVSNVVWSRTSEDTAGDTSWNTAHQMVGMNLEVTDEDMPVLYDHAKFTCTVYITNLDQILSESVSI